ncbi:putative oxidoreductase YgjR [Myriangium duriaei CBS 260.36]|uniref:Oxidoreductase YgjR n=1 Tax=Myriangium duriaei CBS 260.36 TaxID=1168546 RepID=A0A9P4JC25_9PEZI|nr:putative oxidoreductase YgjR [Myriangium duriaei CBS 260.36]
MLKFAIVGTNWITDWWTKSAHASKQWELTAVYSRTPESGKAFAEKYNVSTIYTSIPDLIAAKDVDAVYIASPNSLHYAQAKEILHGGKHVILEKPATSTVAELDELFEIANQKGVFLIEAYRHIHEENFKTAKKLVLEQKKLGPIYGASLVYASFSSRYHNVLAGERPNIFTLDFSGGSLVDLGVYPISFAIDIFGKPNSQVYQAFMAPTGVDGGGFILLQYENFSVQINQSKAFTSTAPTEIYGEKGTISLNGVADISSVKFWSNKTKETEDFSGPVAENNMQAEAQEFARIIEGNDKAAAAKLEQFSKDVIAVTTDLRRQNGIVFKAERK